MLLERNIENIIFIFLALNVFTFIMYGVDKSKARRGRFRIPEGSLILMAFLGGAVGAALGMRVFHHKVNKAKFTTAIPIALVVNILAYAWLIFFA